MTSERPTVHGVSSIEKYKEGSSNCHRLKVDYSFPFKKYNYYIRSLHHQPVVTEHLDSFPVQHTAIPGF